MSSSTSQSASLEGGGHGQSSSLVDTHAAAAHLSMEEKEGEETGGVAMRFYGAHSLRICKIGSSPGCLSLHLHGLALSAKGVFFFLPLCPSLLLFPSSFPPPHSCLSSTAFLGVDFCRSWWSVFEIVLEITRILSLCLPCANVYISNNKLKSNF